MTQAFTLSNELARLDSEQAVENLDGTELHGVAVSVRHVD